MSAPERTVSARAVYPHSSILADGSGASAYLYGSVTAALGVALVYTQADPPFTTIRFVHDGREWEMFLHRGLTRRGLATVANRFVRDVVAGKVEEA